MSPKKAIKPIAKPSRGRPAVAKSKKQNILNDEFKGSMEGDIYGEIEEEVSDNGSIEDMAIPKIDSLITQSYLPEYEPETEIQSMPLPQQVIDAPREISQEYQKQPENDKHESIIFQQSETIRELQHSVKQITANQQQLAEIVQQTLLRSENQGIARSNEVAMQPPQPMPSSVDESGGEQIASMSSMNNISMLMAQAAPLLSSFAQVVQALKTGKESPPPPPDPAAAFAPLMTGFKVYNDMYGQFVTAQKLLTKTTALGGMDEDAFADSVAKKVLGRLAHEEKHKE